MSDERVGDVTISTDCKRVAFQKRDDSGTWMVLDGVPLQRFQGIAASPDLRKFSPDSKRLAYVAGAPDGVRSRIVVGGQEWPAVDKIVQTNNLIFSPDSQRLAAICGNGELSFVMSDGTNGPAYQGLASPIRFSPDGRHLAYIATPRAGKWVLVLDGKPGSEYDTVLAPVFSPDSKHLACVGKRDGKRMVIIDGQEQEAHQEILSVYRASPATGERQRDDSGDALWFSPDSRRLAYIAGTTNRWRMVEQRLEGDRWKVVGHKAQREDWEVLGRPRFSPDSSHLAFCAGRGERQYAFYDGIIREYEGRLVSVGAEFSPDGTTFAHILVRGERKMCVVSNGVPGVDYEHVISQAGGKNLFFSPNSKHLAYMAERNYKYYVVCDGIEGKPCYNVTALRFSPDSKHLGYQADLGGGGRRALVIDGMKADTKLNERIISDWQWADASTACVIVICGEEMIIRLEVTVR